MAREHPEFRQLLEQLNRYFPDREVLTMEEVMQVTGYSRDSVKRHYPFKGTRVTKVRLANLMCER